MVPSFLENTELLYLLGESRQTTTNEKTIIDVMLDMDRTSVTSKNEDRESESIAWFKPVSGPQC